MSASVICWKFAEDFLKRYWIVEETDCMPITLAGMYSGAKRAGKRIEIIGIRIAESDLAAEHVEAAFEHLRTDPEYQRHARAAYELSELSPYDIDTSVLTFKEV